MANCATIGAKTTNRMSALTPFRFSPKPFSVKEKIAVAYPKRNTDLSAAKTCTKCKIEKPCDEFAPQKWGLYGRHAWCHACAAQDSRERAERDREKNRAYQKALRLRDPEAYRAKQKERRDRNGRAGVRAQQRAWHARNPARKILTQAKGRAKKFGLEFSITLDDLLPLPDVCPVLGIPLRKGVGSDDSNAFSLDRIDNSRGYIPGNIAVISRRANVLKRDAAPEEILALARWIQKVTADEQSLAA